MPIRFNRAVAVEKPIPGGKSGQESLMSSSGHGPKPDGFTGLPPAYAEITEFIRTFIRVNQQSIRTGILEPEKIDVYGPGIRTHSPDRSVRRPQLLHAGRREHRAQDARPGPAACAEGQRCKAIPEDRRRSGLQHRRMKLQVPHQRSIWACSRTTRPMVA